ncbi:MAG: flippase [Acidobacteriia bacterium]|nr:flippase [Terriglobia bacterium]
MGDVELVEARPARPKLLPDLVVKNAVALYGVQIGRKVIPLASIPYLARVLGPAGWGEVAFVTALAELIVILIEFGFTLSATRSIARFRDDPLERGKIATGVFCAQMILAACGVGLALIAAPFIPLLRDHPALLAAGLLYAVAQGFVPLWYFQGMERIRLVAVLEISAKVSALGALFVFVKGPHDVWRAVAIQALSPSLCLLLGIVLAFRTSTVCRPRRHLVNAALRESWDMFLFRSAESLYGVANAFLLGLFAPAAIVGYFSAAEKVSKATAGLVNPIRESLYPRISHLMRGDRAEGARLARIGSGLMVAIGFLLSAALFTFADYVIGVLMGGRFEPAVGVLRILSPLPFLLATTFASGQMWLFPLQKDRTVLRVVVRAALINVSLSFLLGPKWGHLGMASAVLISESVVAGSLLWNVLRLERAAILGGALSPSL